jgi:hypothetical protein
MAKFLVVVVVVPPPSVVLQMSAVLPVRFVVLPVTGHRSEWERVLWYVYLLWSR